MTYACSEKWDVDFRIFFLAFPIPGARLLRFVDACYEVDKTIYSASTAGLRKIEKWRNMDPFKYILSEELIARWKKDLCQLLDDIDYDTGNRLSNALQVQAIASGFYGIDHVLDADFMDCVFTTVEENGDFPMSFILADRINTRQSILQKSVKALNLSVELAEDRWRTNTAKPPISATSTNYQDTGLTNQGTHLTVRLPLLNANKF